MRKLKIGFVLLSNRKNPIPSTRISVLNLLPYLREAGCEPHILFEPPRGTEQPDVSAVFDLAVQGGIDIVYFQKVRGPSVVETARRLSARGIKTLYGVCDLIENEMADSTDATVAVTEYLKGLYDQKLQDKIFVVHDAIENPDAEVIVYRNDYGSVINPLKISLVTSQEFHTIPFIDRVSKEFHVNIVGKYEKFPFYHSMRRKFWDLMAQPNSTDKIRYLRNIWRRDFTKINWDIDGVYAVMSTCDLGIIPVDMLFDPLPHQSVSWWQLKSENRLTMMMAMGLPVIASPVPSYQDVIVQGENGYIASSREEWLACFELLRDPQRRAAIGRRARESVIHRYSKAEQARKLVAVLHKISEAA